MKLLSGSAIHLPSNVPLMRIPLKYSKKHFWIYSRFKIIPTVIIACNLLRVNSWVTSGNPNILNHPQIFLSVNLKFKHTRIFWWSYFRISRETSTLSTFVRAKHIMSSIWMIVISLCHTKSKTTFINRYTLSTLLICYKPSLTLADFFCSCIYWALLWTRYFLNRSRI